MKKLFYILMFTVLASCGPSEKDLALYKEQIVQAEKDFAIMVKEKGIAEGFIYYADEHAVMNREKLIKGKDSIKLYYEKSKPNPNIQLSWFPDFVDVSSSGDLGYTYGKYLFEVPDSTGKMIQSRGIFHTIWKRQTDGSWRFVWD